ncbi:MAG: 1-acyl-sn-glycerol-3-phosphate acyltransferase [Acholeplasmatales bacterium]|nr:1-acyl-sn-glycerol-3-phosphate acyltransferase [Acholeplasmatales bacterium]
MTHSKRKNEIVKPRHRIIFSILRLLVGPILKYKYKYNFEYNRKLKKSGPYVIISNHTIALDPLYLALAFPFPIYFVASKEIFNLGLKSKIINYLVSPISKNKVDVDTKTIKNMLKVRDEKGSIGIYPEGNLTYNGQTSKMPNLAKLIKLLKMPLIIYKTSGLYLQNPRWALTKTKGEAYGSIIKIYTADEVSSFDNETLNKILSFMLFNDANYEAINLELPIVPLTSGFERFMFICPACKKIGTIRSVRDRVFCLDCEYLVSYDKYGFLGNIPLKKVDDSIKEDYLLYLSKIDENFEILQGVCRVKLSLDKKKEDLGDFNFNLTKGRLELGSIELDIKYMFCFNNDLKISIQGKNKLLINNDKSTYLIIFSNDISPYLFLLTYQIQSLKEKNNEYSIKLSDIGL